MRVVAFADHQGGAGETATAINLPAALAKTGHRVLPIDPNPQAGAIRELGVRDSRTVFSIPQGDPASTGAILPLVIPFRELAHRALRVRGTIPSTVNGRFHLTRANIALLPQIVPFIRSTVRVSEAPGAGKTPSRRARRHPACGNYRLLAIPGEAPPSSAGSDAPSQGVKPRPSKPGAVGSDA